MDDLNENTDIAVNAIASLAPQVFPDHNIGVNDPNLVNIPSGDVPDINSYFGRNTLLRTISGTGTGGTTLDVAYFHTFLQKTSVGSKLRNFGIMRCNVNLEFILNVNPFCTGLVTICFHMGNLQDNFYGPLGHTAMLTRDHIIMDVARQTRATVKLPFKCITPYARQAATLATDQIREMKLSLSPVTDIVDATTGTSSPWQLYVYAHLSEVELAQPTAWDAGYQYTSEVREASKGPISYPASIIEMASAKLSQVPVLGPYARAVQGVAGVVKHVSKLFGFSRPIDTSPFAYPHQEDYSSYVGNLRCKKITLDPMAEVTIDNGMYGDNVDTLTMDNTIRRWGHNSHGTWTPAQGHSAIVIEIPVCPHYCLLLNDGYFAPSPLVYFSTMYSFWRGSIEYKIYIPVNRFIRGKLRFWWSPVRLTPTQITNRYDQITQNAPSILVDVSQTVELTIIVSYAMAYPYANIPLITYDYNNLGPNSLNGWLYCTVEEPMLAQSESYAADLLIMHRAGDDFDLQVTNTTKMQYLNVGAKVPSSEMTAQWHTIVWPQPDKNQLTVALQPTADTYYFTSAEGNSEVNQQTIRFMQEADMAQARQRYMGEAFNSFRPMLKRFYRYMAFDPNRFPDPATEIIKSGIFMPYIPYMRAKAGGEFAPVSNTPVAWVTNTFYGVRGAIRYMMSSDKHFNRNWCFERGMSYPHQGHFWRDSYGRPDINLAFAQREEGAGQAQFINRSNEPMFAEIPFQNAVNFMRVSRVRQMTNQGTQYGALFNCLGSFRDDVGEKSFYVAIGEDFQGALWNGCPSVWVGATPLSSPALLANAEMGDLEQLEKDNEIAIANS